MQKFTSANTSINSKKLPAIYKNKKVIELIENKKIIDIGGGKFDNAKNYCLYNYNTVISIYDKFNRTEENNKKVLADFYDIAICSNVLNVIDNSNSRKEVIKLCKQKAKITLFTVYEGDKSGIGKQTSFDSWQENRKTEDYIKEIRKVFDKVERFGKLIIAK